MVNVVFNYEKKRKVKKLQKIVVAAVFGLHDWLTNRRRFLHERKRQTTLSVLKNSLNSLKVS